VPGFGFLRDLFSEAFLVRWDLTRSGATTPDLPGAKIKLDGFLGIIGVAPGPDQTVAWKKREGDLAAAGGVALPPQPTQALPADVCGENGSAKDLCLRTIPPRKNGGNRDIKKMQVGTTMLLPCYVKGCLLPIGDVHFAQGDGDPQVSGWHQDHGFDQLVGRRDLGRARCVDPHDRLAGDEQRVIARAGVLLVECRGRFAHRKFGRRAELRSLRDRGPRGIHQVTVREGEVESPACSMNRRSFFLSGFAISAWTLLSGYSPYRKFQIYRKTRLIVMAPNDDPRAGVVADGLAEFFASYRKDSKSTSSRARVS
jgi:Acetamidase/Formamidase family